MESCESLPKVKRKVTQHMPVRVVSDPAGEPGAACGDPEAAGQTLRAFRGLSRGRPYTSQGVFEHYGVCMPPVFTLELGGVLCVCMLERLCIAVASVHG